MRFTPDNPSPDPVPTPKPPKPRRKVVVVDVKQIARETLATPAVLAFNALPDAMVRLMANFGQPEARVDLPALRADFVRYLQMTGAPQWPAAWTDWSRQRTQPEAPAPVAVPTRTPRLVKQANGGFRIHFTPKDTLVHVSTDEKIQDVRPPARLEKAAAPTPALTSPLTPLTSPHPWAARLQRRRLAA